MIKCETALYNTAKVDQSSWTVKHGSTHIPRIKTQKVQRLWADPPDSAMTQKLNSFELTKLTQLWPRRWKVVNWPNRLSYDTEGAKGVNWPNWLSYDPEVEQLWTDPIDSAMTQKVQKVWTDPIDSAMTQKLNSCELTQLTQLRHRRCKRYELTQMTQLWPRSWTVVNQPNWLNYDTEGE